VWKNKSKNHGFDLETPTAEAKSAVPWNLHNVH